jgi:hypothetical protein
MFQEVEMVTIQYIQFHFTQLHGLCVSARGINQNIRFSSKVAEKDGACNIMEFTSQEF